MWPRKTFSTDELVNVQPIDVELTPETKEQIMNLLSEIHVANEILDDLLERANQIALAVKVDLKEHIQIAPEPVEQLDAKPDAPSTGKQKAGQRRDSPYTRRPMSEQYEWVLGLMADGQWHTALEFAKEYATDERHHRYLKGAINGRMGELYREGKLERGDSEIRGSMFKYRLARP